jgi:hypothetical protein
MHVGYGQRHVVASMLLVTLLIELLFVEALHIPSSLLELFHQSSFLKS